MAMTLAADMYVASFLEAKWFGRDAQLIGGYPGCFRPPESTYGLSNSIETTADTALN